MYLFIDDFWFSIFIIFLKDGCKLLCKGSKESILNKTIYDELLGNVKRVSTRCCLVGKPETRYYLVSGFPTKQQTAKQNIPELISLTDLNGCDIIVN